MCTYSAGCLVISPSSGHGGAAANNIPYSIALLDAQGSTVSAVPAQEQPPQIGRLVADNREQFRVRAVLPCKLLPGVGNTDILYTSYFFYLSYYT